MVKGKALPLHAVSIGPPAGEVAGAVFAEDTFVGRDAEMATLRQALDAAVPYVGLVASRKRGAAVLGDLRSDGVPDEQLERIDVPAGIDIGSRTAAEIALSILATVVATRRGERTAAPGNAPIAVASAAPPLAIDPICGMTVAAVPGTPSVEHEGETVYFCCDGCKAKFEAQHRAA